MPSLPPLLETLVDDLASMDGVVAVTLGGSRAAGLADAGSDRDLGVYYRRAIDTTALARGGTVYPPGAWGRIMNGGAWLRADDGAKVDVLLRDLDAVDLWSERAREGVYEVDALLGYLAGAPTYLLSAERAVGVALRGSLPPAPAFPPRLAEVVSGRWRFSSRFTLDYARMLAARGDVAGTAGQGAKAAIEHTHAVLCEQLAWVLNEKRILERAGLAGLHGLFAAIPAAPSELSAWVERLGRSLAG